MLITDSDGVVFFISPVAQRFFQAGDQGLIGRHIKDVLQTSLQETEFLETFQTKIQEGKHIHLPPNFLHARIGNRDIPLTGKVLPIKRSFGGRYDAIWILSGFEPTQLSHMQEQLQEVQILLKEKLGEIKRIRGELTSAQHQLFHYQKLEIINRVANGIGHDFNILLSGILSYANILKDELKDNVKAAKRLNMIQKLTKRGNELAKQLFHFSQKQDGEKIKVNLNEAVAEASNILYHSVPKTITIKTALAQDLWSVEGNTTQIMQVLINMGLNAQDAMPAGGEILFETQNLAADERFCRLHAKLKVGNYVRISVIDTGTGIAQEHTEKIFHPFFTTKGYGKRAGLGLSLVTKIMQWHRGCVSVSSQKNKGAAFHLYFPAAANGKILALCQTCPAAQELTIPAADSKANAVGLQGKTILIIDDERLMRNLAQAILEPTGANLLFAENGEQALEICSQNLTRIDAVVLDLVMPGSDSIKLFKKIRKIHPELKVVFACGYCSSEMVGNLRESQNVDFAQKPFTDDLARILTQDRA